MKRKRVLSVLFVSWMVLISLITLFQACAPERKPNNIAFRRAAWHSSAANFDNTGHLISDGIIGFLSSEVIDYNGTSASNPTYGQMIPGIVNSEWISASNGEEWVYLDFGAISSLESVKVYWGANYAVTYDIQVSNDAKVWETVARPAGAADLEVETRLATCESRYLRILCRTSSGLNYIIREVEVTGVNDVVYGLAPQSEPEADGSLKLTGGNWTIQRASLVNADGKTLSQAEYDDSSWLPATVPGTAFVSYLKAGAVPDPYYDDWQFQASDIFFTADFWYRNSFEIPASQKDKMVYLNFDAINWKADVWFNGHFLTNTLPGYSHSIEGAFTRAKFDISAFANYGSRNDLAVLIHRNKTPGLITTQGLAEGPLPNGGELGQDSPTIHAAVGWDWLPTIRGRDIGIYNDVTVTYGGAVQLEDPWMETDLDIMETSANISAKNLGIGKAVTQPARQKAVNLKYVNDNDENTQWIGEDMDGAGFTIDLGQITAINSLQIIWGSEAGGAAAAAGERRPAKFKVQVSDDNSKWRNFDFYAGGEVDTGWFGVRSADPTPGTEEYDGFDISNELPGPVATVKVSWGDNKEFPIRIPVVQKARYVRFESTKRRQVEQQGNRVVPTRVREFRIYKETTQEVEQSMIRTYALDSSRADLTFRTDMHNYRSEASDVTINGVITPGNISFSKTIVIPGKTNQNVMIDHIILDNPELWWPNTYGEQPLYIVEANVSVNGVVQDRANFRFGVREFTYPIDGNRLTLYCNGTRIVAKGGNWGMDDGLKTDTPEKYDDKMRLHAENNFTMIRNWVGITNNRVFYDAADKYGILIWDDFWLANPVDGPNPDDETMFLDNAKDKIKKNRYHAALAIYCGRNESSPPKTLDDGLRQRTQDYDGIIAGSCANRHIHMWTAAVAQSVDLYRHPERRLTEGKASLLNQMVMNTCDTLKEGFLNNPRQCEVDFSKLLCAGDKDDDTCLTTEQLKTVDTFYNGVKNSRGELIFSGQALGNPISASQDIGQGPGVVFDIVRIAFNDPALDWREFDLDRDMPLIDKALGYVDAVDPDLSKFKTSGGKLLLTHGWSDPGITPETTILYYESVLDTMGRDQSDWIRLFLGPGMGHCGGGPGVNSFDSIGTLEKWIEKGVAPDQITGTGEDGLTRPLCPYPQYADYKGTGDLKKAENWTCKEPDSEK